MTAKKNLLAAILSKVIAVASDRKFFSASADLYGLTLQKFADNYRAELDDWIRVRTKPAAGCARELNCDGLQIAETVRDGINRGHFQLGDDRFKIHWVRRGTPAIKGLAVDMKDIERTIQYGDGEYLSPPVCVLPSVIHALYRTTTTDRRKVFALWQKIFEYFGQAVQTTRGALAERQRATMSEKFQFEGATLAVTVTSFAVDGNFRTNLYMAAFKESEFELVDSLDDIFTDENIKRAIDETLNEFLADKPSRKIFSSERSFTWPLTSGTTLTAP